MAIAANASFNNAVALEGIEPIILVEIAADTDWYFATRKLQSGAGVGYDNYDAVIKRDSLTSIDQDLPNARFGMSIIGDIELTINNADPIKSDDVPADLTYLENKEIIVKYGFNVDNAGDTFLLSNFVTLYTGFVVDYNWTESELSITIIDATIKRHKTIPQTRNNDTASPEKNIGLVVPILYGDWTSGYAKGLITDLTLGTQKVRFDTQQLHTMTKLFQHDKDFDAFIGLSETEVDGTGAPEYVFTAASAWAIFSAATNPFAEKGQVLFRDFMLLNKTLDSNNVTNPDNAFDGNDATFARFPITNPAAAPADFIPRVFRFGDTFDGYADARYNIAQFTSLGTIIAVILACKVDMPAGFASSEDPPKYFAAQINPVDAFDKDGNDISFVGGGFDGGNDYDNYKTELFLFTTDINNLAAPSNFPNLYDQIIQTISAVGSSGAGGDDFKCRWKRQEWNSIKNGRLVFLGYYSNVSNQDFTVDVYEAKLLFIYVTKFDETFNLFLTGKGRRFEAGWTGKTSTSLVEKPADTINAIYRHELGLVDADIDETAFSAVNAFLGADKFAGNIVAEEMSSKIIDRLCRQCMTRNFKRNDGTESLKAYDTSVASSKDFDSSMISNVSIGRSDLSLVYNQFYLNYNKNMATGEFDSQIFVTEGDNNFNAGGAAYETICTNSQSNYGFVNTFTLDADFIRDSVTAEDIIKKIADYHSDRHYQISFTTQVKNGLLLELADVITIDYDWLPTVVDGAAKKWEIVSIKKSLTQVQITAESFDA